MSMNPSKKIKSLFSSHLKPRRSAGRFVPKPDRRLFGYPEQLEMRLMPAVFIVTNINDTGAGSLRQAILDANANTTDAIDTIQFSSSLAGSNITLSSMVTVNDTANKGLVINGSGASNLTLAGGNSTGLLQFNTSTTITDLKLGSAASNNVILRSTNCLTLSNIVLAGSLTANGCTTTSCFNLSGPVRATGNGAVSITARNVCLTSGISTQAGNITVTADNGAFQTGAFPGIFMNGTAANLATTGGSVMLKGRGGSAAAAHLTGVCIAQGTIYAGGRGSITIQGVGSNSSSTSEGGVCITNANLSTANGSINIIGNSCGTGGTDYGVYLDSTSIFANGTGCLSLTGTSGNGSSVETGVLVSSSNLSTAGGCITLTGTSCGTGNQDIGVHYSNSSIQVQGGTGGISITGVSGVSPTSVSSEVGIYMFNGVSGNRISTTNGPIVLNGLARGLNSNNTGVAMNSNVLISAGGSGRINLLSQSANISALGYTFSGGQLTTNGGNITISANSVSLDPIHSKINATANGTVRFQTLGAGINLGGTDSSANLGLSVAEISTITAGTLSIGRFGGSVEVPNFGFETPQLPANSFAYTPANASWSFTVNSGISANGSGFGSPTALQGKQVGIVQGGGVIQQNISGFNDDALYTISFNSASRPGFDFNPVQVSVGNTNLGNFTPVSSTSYGLNTTPIFSSLDSSANIVFAGQSVGLDRTTFIDSVTINPINTPNIFISDSIAPSNITNLHLFTSGNISETGAGNLILSSGTANFSAGGCITLGNATNRLSTFGGIGTNMTVVNSGAIQLGRIVATGRFSLNAGGAITQTAAAAVTGNSILSTPGYPITLSQNNTFQGLITSCGSSIQISNANSKSLNVNSPVAVSGYTGVTANMTVSLNGNSTPTIQWKGQIPGYISMNSTTQGNWKGVFGNSGSVIPNETTRLPSYAGFTTNGSRYTWDGATTDIRALQKTADGSVDRFASCWFANSELSLNLTMTDGKLHPVSLFFMDWDRLGRVVTVDVIDTSTNTVLDTRTISNYGDGIWATWNVQGSIQFKITKASGHNAVVNGLFIDDENWTNISGATSATYSIQAASTSDDGSRFRALVTNSIGTFTTSSARLSVSTGAAPSVTLQPVSSALITGTTATFTAAATGYPVPTVQWQVSTNNGSTWNPISGATSTTYSIQGSLNDNGKQYRAIFSNVIGSATTTSATLSVSNQLTTLDVGGVQFRYDSGFQVSGTTYTANGTVYMGYVPASGDTFYRLLELGGNFSVNASTLMFSASGAVKTAAFGPSVILVSGGISSRSISDLINDKIAITAGSIVSVAGVNFTLDKIGFKSTGDNGKPLVQLQGSVALPGGLNLAVNGTNTVNITTSGFSLTGACASLSNNFTVGALTFAASNLTGSYAVSTNTFTVTGQSSAAVSGLGNVNVIFGGSNSTGLIVTNGSLTSMNVTVSGNLSILSTNFTANRINMTVNTTANTFTMTGNATLTQSKIGSLSVIFGGANSTGLILTNGSLTSANMTVNSNLTVAGSTFQTVGLNITANTNTNTFTMKGNASLNMPSIGAVSIGFGCGSTSGLVLTNGLLTTLNATVTGNLSIGSVSFATNNLTFAVNTVTDIYSLTGGSSFTASGIGNANVYFGGIGSSGLVIANGSISSLNMTVSSNLTLAGVAFNTTNMIITGDTANSIYTMTGCTSLSVSGIGNMNVQFGKKDTNNNVLSRGLVITSGSLSLLNMTVNNNISVAGMTFSTANMNFNYTAANNSTASQFSMTGLTSATIASLGSISFGFGCSTTGGSATKGLVISGGNLTSLDMSVTSSLSVGGLSFSTNNLKFLYNASPSYFAMRGLASVTVPSVGSLSVGFGSGTTNGLVVTNGSFTSLDMSVNSNLNIGSLNITTQNLNFNYTAASNNFTMRGTASVAMPSIGNLGVTFGSNTTSGLVITNGSFTSLDMTVNSNFSVGSMSFTTRNLNINYISGNNSFAMTGTAAMAMPSIGNLEVTLGKTAGNGTIINRGLVINNGAFSSLDITVNSNFTSGNLQFYTKDLNVQYYNSNATFMMKGTAGLDLPSIGNVNVTLGNATRNGVVFVNGAFQSFDFTLNSNIRVGMVDITTQDLNFAYTNANQTFTIRGTAGVAMPSIGNVNVTLGNATRNGLVITNGALVSLDMTLNSNFRAGGILFTTRNLNFTYVTSTSEFTMSGTAAVAMPSLGSVEVTLGKVDADGTVRSRGLIVRNGNFVSLDMTVNANIYVSAVMLYTRNLNFT
jgi:hypothetical protein